LAQADILGIFGREGLDLATLWSPPDLTDPGTFAFLMYLNYDGAGSGFGDTSVFAASDDQQDVAIYAATRQSDGALTLMLINKTNEQLISPVSISNFTTAITAEVYRYSTDDLTAIARLPAISIARDGFSADLSANSITLIVIPSGVRAASDQTGPWATDATWLGDVVPSTDAAVAITSATVVTIATIETVLQVIVDNGARLEIVQNGSLVLQRN
jgi:hypothetical protein